jgi:hypothetical protein
MYPYQTIEPGTNPEQIESQLPAIIRGHVLAIIESDPNSRFCYTMCQLEWQYTFYLIEQNEFENYTTCHLFSTDTCAKTSDDYIYLSISLPDLEVLAKMANALRLT